MSDVLEVCEERVAIRRDGGSLEGVLTYAFDVAPSWGVLIAGPHPFLGGDLKNNVVKALSRNLAAAGAVTLAFNYGGIGEGGEDGLTDWSAAISAFWKEGRIEEESGWIHDTEAAIVALHGWCDRPLVLVGYSFGCWAISENVGDQAACAVILLSPNPGKHAFDGLDRCDAPLLVLHTDNDFACGVDEVVTWFDGLREPKTRRLLSAGEHFFRGSETALVEAILEYLKELKLEGVTVS